MSKKTMHLLEEAIPVFELLADRNRQKILIQLFDNGAQSVTQITEEIELTQPAVSHHLKLLRLSGLVAVTQKGKERYYELKLDSSLTLLEEIVNSVKADLVTLNKNSEA